MSQSPVITVLATALCLTFLAESRGATMFEPKRLPMRAEEFEIARRRMLAEISARAVQLRETTGRAAFDERVMAAMGRVPRHEFVPIDFSESPARSADADFVGNFQNALASRAAITGMADFSEASWSFDGIRWQRKGRAESYRKRGPERQSGALGVLLIRKENGIAGLLGIRSAP
jgi:hypothetical protein